MSRLSDDEKRFLTDQISMLKGENERLTDRLEDEEGLKMQAVQEWNRVEVENKALSGLLRKHRQLIAGYGAGSEKNLLELDALLAGAEDG